MIDGIVDGMTLVDPKCILRTADAAATLQVDRARSQGRPAHCREHGGRTGLPSAVNGAVNSMPSWGLRIVRRSLIAIRCRRGWP